MKSALEVTHWLLYKANCEGEIITNLKLQKLLYYAQAWYLVNYNEPLFKEPIQAWSYGPVIPEVYKHYKDYGAKPIEYNHTGKEPNTFTPIQLEFLEEFYDIFIRVPAHALVNMSHNEEPWILAYDNGPNTVISLDNMKNYYSKLIKQIDSDGNAKI